MTYRGISFNSLAEYNAVLDQNQGWRVVSACPGNISGSIFATFDIPAEKETASVAEKGSHKPKKYPASEEEDDPMVEEEEVKEKEPEEEQPKPRRAVPRRPAAPSRHAATAIKQPHHHQQQKKKGK